MRQTHAHTGGRNRDSQSKLFRNLLIRRFPSHDGQFVWRGRRTQAERPILPFIAFEAPKADIRIDRFGIVLRSASMITRPSACK